MQNILCSTQVKHTEETKKKEEQIYLVKH